MDALLSLGKTPVGVADDQSRKRITELAGQHIEYTSVGDRKEPNLELIAQLTPDLIIADKDRHAKVYEQLSQIAPTIVLNSREGSYQDIKDGVRTVSRALGDAALGDRVLSKHEATMARRAQELSGKATDRTIQLVTARDQLLRIHSSSSFVGGVMTALNLKVAVQSPEPYEDASLERLSAINPSVLLIAADSKNPITKQWAKANSPLWTKMTAVTQGRAFEVDRNLFTRFRGLNAAERMAQTMIENISG